MKWSDDLDHWIDSVPDWVKFLVLVVGAVGVMALEAVYPVPPAP